MSTILKLKYLKDNTWESATWWFKMRWPQQWSRRLSSKSRLGKKFKHTTSWLKISVWWAQSQWWWYRKHMVCCHYDQPLWRNNPEALFSLLLKQHLWFENFETYVRILGYHRFLGDFYKCLRDFRHSTVFSKTYTTECILIDFLLIQWKRLEKTTLQLGWEIRDLETEPSCRLFIRVKVRNIKTMKR